MIRLPWTNPLVVWAARDLLRQPVRTLLSFCALSSLVALISLLLLLNQALTEACSRSLAQAPSIVVRRINAGGWAPMPGREALQQVATVAGVLNPRIRVWGAVRGPDGPVTIVGMTKDSDGDLPQGLPHPLPGQALAGKGVGLAAGEIRLPLFGHHALTVTVIGQLPSSSSMATHDVVVLHVNDARTLLGLEKDQASDLVMDVFHDEEAQSMGQDLAAAFDWPVQITTRREQLGYYLSMIARRTRIALVAFVPAILAMAFMVVTVGTWGRLRRWEIGLFKALGWTGADILRLHLYRGIVVGLPAAALGAATAYLLLYWPGTTWVSRWLFGWIGSPPAYYLTSQGAFGGLALSVLGVTLPFMAAIFWTGWQSAATDPADCIEGDP